MGPGRTQQPRLDEARQLVVAAMRAQAAQGGLWQEHQQLSWWQSPIAASGANLVVDCGADPHSQLLTRVMALMRWSRRPVGWLIWPDQNPALQHQLLYQRGYRQCEQLWLGSLTPNSAQVCSVSRQVRVVRPFEQLVYASHLQQCHHLGVAYAQLLTATFLNQPDTPSVAFKVFTIRFEGQIVAAITACVLPADPRLGNLLWLGVLPSWRRRGFARTITLQACSWMVALGVQRIHVQASAMAVGLYRSLGFKPYGDLNLWGAD